MAREREREGGGGICGGGRIKYVAAAKSENVICDAYIPR